jgi:hypothetical protein
MQKPNRSWRGAQYVLLALATLAWLPACNIHRDPAKTVTVKIHGLTDDDDRDLVEEQLDSLLDDEGTHLKTIVSVGDEVTMELSPVTDVQRFAQAIDFAKVNSVNGRTVDLQYPPQRKIKIALGSGR